MLIPMHVHTRMLLPRPCLGDIQESGGEQNDQAKSLILNEHFAWLTISAQRLITFGDKNTLMKILLLTFAFEHVAQSLLV